MTTWGRAEAGWMLFADLTWSGAPRPLVKSYCKSPQLATTGTACGPSVQSSVSYPTRPLRNKYP